MILLNDGLKIILKVETAVSSETLVTAIRQLIGPQYKIKYKIYVRSILSYLF